MKNLTTKEFCDKFSACHEGRKFAKKYETMRDCYAALLNGEAEDYSAEWAIWTFSREGATSERTQRLFAVRCARKVQHLMKDERSIAALDVAERYANGKATDEELKAALAAAWDAMADERCSALNAALNAARTAARTAAWAAAWAAALNAARDAALAEAWTEARKEQLQMLKEIGNIFEEESVAVRCPSVPSVVVRPEQEAKP